MKSFINIAEGIFLTVLCLLGLYVVLCFLNALLFGEWTFNIFGTNRFFGTVIFFTAFYSIRSLITWIKDKE